MSDFTRKRGSAPAPGDVTSSGNRKRGGGDSNSNAKDGAAGDSGLDFEDPFGDEYEDEQLDELMQGRAGGGGGGGGDEEDDEEEVEDEEGVAYLRKQQAGRKSAAQELVDEDDANNAPKQVWRPGVDQLPEGEELEYDPSAYIMYHSLEAEWPCLSFDIVRDNLGENRQRVRARTLPPPPPKWASHVP